MTINEIEITLETLRARHPNLNEASLTTLLTAGGWDEKSISESLLVFRNVKEKPETREMASLIPLEEPPFLPPFVDEEHRILEHNPEDIVEDKAIEKKVESIPVVVKNIEEKKEKEEKIKSEPAPTPSLPLEPVQVPIHEPEPEPESLIKPVIFSPAKFPEPPHNLPLRPFESGDHVWPFSRYKDVFYGEVMPTLSPDEKKLAEKHKVHIHLDKEPLTSKDETLMFVSGMMVLVILLLLLYMYSNGRL